ncbi:uncharacterized protein [Miscanthus floridulus]|uniref:uncharacterized protein n=1 Tax=Miscanthus floridulus TaxID=154761 RepID=UPI0034587EAC
MHREREKSGVQQRRHPERLFCVDGERKAKCASSLRLLSPQPKSLAERWQSRRQGRVDARRTRKREEGAGQGLGKEAAARARRDTATEEAIVPPVLRGGSVTGCSRLGEAHPRRGGSAVERGQADHDGEDSSFEPAAAAAPPVWAPPRADAVRRRRRGREREKQRGRSRTGRRRRVAPTMLCPNAGQDKRERERREEKAEEAEKKGRDGGSRAARPRRQGRWRGGGRGAVLQRLASAARIRGEGGAGGTRTAEPGKGTHPTLPCLDPSRRPRRWPPSPVGCLALAAAVATQRREREERQMWSERWLTRTFAYAVGGDLFWVPDSGYCE